MSTWLPDLISLPAESKSHFEAGHTLFQPTKAGFVQCSCGLSFRVGIIVDKTTISPIAKDQPSCVAIPLS